MKNLKLVLLLLSSLLLINCSDDDPKSSLTDSNAMVLKLVNVSGSIAGVSHDFNEGEVTWTLDEENQTIKVVNNFTDTNVYSGIASGTYDYENVPNEITPQSCATTIEINGTLNMGCKDNNGNTITFTQLEADGYVFTFKY
ncbi:hypothetical protein [Flavobacterium sp. NRK1]|uniref:hypothetical protein n=1 Tax=Flavobacterium sp. NRK1 TaxID=2954929 RepID=UPI002092CF70|nr:hypothetical protein [Flavobacterium sp. NRK1]MCO6149623.1 hypothetical protein [Flavobacterium sp. NRK1]